MRTIVDACGCHASKQSDSRDRGLISSLPIPYCAKSLLYVDFIHGLPRFGGYDSCLVVTCGLSRFTRVFPCNGKITGEQTVKLLVEQWFEPYGAPKQVHSDEDVRIRSDTGWYKRVLNALNVEVTTGVPYGHTSNPLCERQNRVVEGKKLKPDETGAYQGLGTPSALGSAYHELTAELFYGFHPPRTVPWRTTCLVLQNPLS